MKTRPLNAALLLVATLRAAGAVVVRAGHGSAATSASISAMSAHRFGPNHCVAIERSSSGSCRIKTACRGQDTSAVEFAFDCWAPNGDIFRHSFGVGGFAEQEDFDSEVQCAQCHPPADDTAQKAPAPLDSKVPAALASKPTAKGAVSFTKKEKKKESQHPLLHSGPLLSPALRAAATIRATEDNVSKAMAAAVPMAMQTPSTAPQSAGGMGDLATKRHVKAGPSISRYGPKSCVSTWRNPEGHCVLETACQDADISSYEFGLVCIDAKGLKTKHTFGRGSFDVTETFDTLAECSECIGLDDQRVVALRVQRQRWKQSEEASQVATLSEEVSSLTKTMTSMLGAVMTLRKKVKAEKKVAPDPAAATLAVWSGEDAPAAQAEAAPVATPRLRSAAPPPQSAAQVKHGSKKHHHHKKVVEEEEEEDDEDDDDDEEESGHQDKAKDSEADENLTPETNGIGEILDDGSEAEASEASVASDGMASAGALDDGSYGLETGW